MTTLDYLEQIDETLSHWESYFHGQEGRDVTVARANLSKVKELCTTPSVKCSVVRFAWGNEKLKTWFITKTSKAVLPKGSKLLFKMGCERTNKTISITYTLPKQGDVINDVDSNKFRIVSVEWF